MKTYERDARSLPAQGGQPNYWAIPYPGECQLTKLIVTQQGGTIVPFDVDIFNALIAVTDSRSSGGGDPAGDYTVDPHNHRVVSTLHSDTPGHLFVQFDDSVGHFVNKDVAGSTNRVQKIYLQITPEGSGEMTFDVTIGSIRDIG